MVESSNESKLVEKVHFIYNKINTERFSIRRFFFYFNDHCNHSLKLENRIENSNEASRFFLVAQTFSHILWESVRMM